MLTLFHVAGIVPDMAARPRSPVQRKQTGVRLTPEIYKALQHVAIDEGQPVSYLIEKAIRDYLEKRGVSVSAPSLIPDEEGE